MATSDTQHRKPRRASIQKGAALVSIVFLLVGVAGFIPGITANYSSLRFAGHHSEAQLFGYFQVSVLHNVVHLLFGVAGLVLARTALGARNFLLYGGLAYAVLFFYGILIEYQSSANFVPFDDADNALHFALAVGMLVLSFLLDRGPDWRDVVVEGKASV
jgi:hypothetical protein